jgi:hypothetical protein
LDQLEQTLRLLYELQLQSPQLIAREIECIEALLAGSPADADRSAERHAEARHHYNSALQFLPHVREPEDRPRIQAALDQIAAKLRVAQEPVF